MSEIDDDFADIFDEFEQSDKSAKKPEPKPIEQPKKEEAPKKAPTKRPAVPKKKEEKTSDNPVIVKRKDPTTGEEFEDKYDDFDGNCMSCKRGGPTRPISGGTAQCQECDDNDSKGLVWDEETKKYVERTWDEENHDVGLEEIKELELESEVKEEADELLEFLEETETKTEPAKIKAKTSVKEKEKEKEKPQKTTPITNTNLNKKDRKESLIRPHERKTKSSSESITGLEIPEPEPMTADDVREADTWFIYGEKSDGKTSFALSFPGNILVLQFDEKAGVVWKEDFDSDPRIVIYDITKLIRSDDPILYLETSTLALAYIEKIMEKAREMDIDWILIDGFESFTTMAEMAMRYDQNLRYEEGVPMQTWKVRTLFMSQLHTRAINIAKKGVIYTTYPFIEELVEFNGKTQKTKKPKWQKDSEKETDQLVQVYSEDNDKKGTQFWIYLEKMKRGFYSGKRINITVEKGKPRIGYKLMIENGSVK